MIILGMTIYQLLEFFLLYSFLGWCVEVVYHAVVNHKIINRGFLNGPVCPVYGFGVVAVLGAVRRMLQLFPSENGELPLPVLFILGLILTTTVELIGGFALDKFFHARWWDYSNQRFNLHGYICLRFSIIWGFAIVLVIRIAHPFISHSMDRFIPQNVGWWLILFFCLFYMADFVISVMAMLQINQELKELEEIRSNMRRFSDSISMLVGESTFLAKDVYTTLQSVTGENTGVSDYQLKDERPKSKNQLETYAEFERKKEQAGEKYREQVQSTKENLSQRAELARDKANAVKDKASAVKDKASAAREMMLEKTEQALAQLGQKKNAWFQRFRGRSHITLRRILKYPRFRHLKYDEALREIREEVRKTENKHTSEELAG